MTDCTPAEVRLLDSGYIREVRSVLYHAYRHEPTYAYLLDVERPGFDHRVRATVREWVNRHFAEELPAIGLLVDDRLIGVALIAPPRKRLEIIESWRWRWGMLLSAGVRCTRRFVEYKQAVLECLPPGAYHLLPLIGIHPQFQGQKRGEQLLAALHQWCAEDPHSQGVVVESGNARYVDFYHRQGYEILGELAIGPIVERVFFHPNPVPLVQ